MAATSAMLELGTRAPHFTLPDVRTREEVSLEDFGSRPLLVAFVSNHCPYVKHIQPGLVRLGEDYAGREVGIVAVASNDPSNHPDDSPEQLARVADELGYPFPVLYDEEQEVAESYAAACTPDFFLFDHDHRLVYRGQFDDSRPGNGRPVTGADLRAALERVLAGEPVDQQQRPSVGCSIKWKPGKGPR